MNSKSNLLNHKQPLNKDSEFLVEEVIIKEEPNFQDSNSYLSGTTEMHLEKEMDSLVKTGSFIKEEFNMMKKGINDVYHIEERLDIMKERNNIELKENEHLFEERKTRQKSIGNEDVAYSYRVSKPMDIQLIISKIYERTPLWNKRSKSHANRNIINKLWAEISLETGYKEILVKKKWKYLRDQFAIELKKVTPGRSSDAACDRTKSKWQYFDSLSFLKDILEPKPSSGNLSGFGGEILDASDELNMDPSSVSEESASASLDTQHESAVPEENIPMTKSKPYFSASFSKKIDRSKYQKTQDYNDTILDIERQKLQYLIEKSSHKQDKDDDDDNLLFFKSLLPLVTTIPITHKMSFRSRIQDVVQQFAFPEYVYPQNSSVSSPRVSPFSSAASPMNLHTGKNTRSSPQYHFPTTSNNFPPDLPQNQPSCDPLDWNVLKPQPQFE